MKCARLIQIEIQAERPEHSMTRAMIDAAQPGLPSRDVPAAIAFLRNLA